MKKIALLISILTLTFASVAWAGNEVVDTADWYKYNNHSGSHSFSLNFPTDWKVKTFGTEERGFLPEEKITDDPMLMVRQFEGYTYNEVITHYKDPSVSFLQAHDFLMETPEEEVIAKKVYFADRETGETISKTMIKRGGQIVVLSQRTEEYQEITDAIIETFVFTDNWKGHIDFIDKYTFIIPSNYKVEKTRDEVVIKNMAGREVFNIKGDTMADIAQTHITKTIRESFDFFEIPIYSTYPFKHFLDVRDNHPNAEAINELVDRGVIGGYVDGTFRPDDPVSRAEMIKMIVPPVFQIILNPRIFRNCFVDGRGEWFESKMCFAKAMGWVGGYPDGTFRPEESVSRAEGIKLILESSKRKRISPNETLKENIVDDIAQGEWYEKYFIYADNRNLLDKQHVSWEGDRYLYFPSEKITRKEVAEMIFRIKYK